MEDHNMEEVEEEQLGGPSSPPRKKAKTNGEASSELSLPNSLRLKIAAHERECTSLLFLNNSPNLITGGKDSIIKSWDTSTGAQTRALEGFGGSPIDLAISSDNTLLVAALTSKKICVWDLNSGQLHRTLEGSLSLYGYMCCAVDIISKATGHYIVSGGYPGIILWDLKENYPIRYWVGDNSNCNAVCFAMDGDIICSGHNNGKIIFTSTSRSLWSIGEVKAHTQPVTSVSLLHSGNVVLSSGRDNWHNFVDVRTMQVCGKFKTRCNQVVSNWSRTCVSPDDSFVAVGSGDGTVSIWSTQMGRIVKVLSEHSGSVVSCSWSGTGRPLASADSNGSICIWS